MKSVKVMVALYSDTEACDWVCVSEVFKEDSSEHTLVHKKNRNVAVVILKENTMDINLSRR